MKSLCAFALLLVALGCQEQESVSEFTGNEVAYELIQGSDYAISGVVTFKERVDGFTTVAIQLKGTSGEALHPVHVHLGTIDTPKADVAALLSPVTAATGSSVTLLTKLADETPITFKSIAAIKACIKIHLADTGAGRDVVLAGGNIGASYGDGISSGRTTGMAICK